MLHVGPRFGLVANCGLRWHRGAQRGGMPSSVAGFGVLVSGLCFWWNVGLVVYGNISYAVFLPVVLLGG